MGMEGRPEKELITDEQYVEALKSNDTDLMEEWWEQERARADQDSTGLEGIKLDAKYAEILVKAGQWDRAFEYFEKARAAALVSDFAGLYIHITHKMEDLGYKGIKLE